MRALFLIGPMARRAATALSDMSAEGVAMPGENYREVKVGYTGEWSAITEQLQPVVTDSGFRKSSVETYQPPTGRGVANS
jgi:hypothetical protein